MFTFQNCLLWAIPCLLIMPACGEPQKVLGDLCGQPECEYDALVCEFQIEPRAAYRVTCLSRRADEPLAVLHIDVEGLDDVGQFELPVPDPGGRVVWDSPILDDVLKEVQRLRLEVLEGGLEPGKTLHGRLVGMTLDGFQLEALHFDCELQQR